jgi:WD40 repeat protein
VQIIQLKRDEAGNNVFKKQCEFEHPYPATKVMWAPAKHNLGERTDLLATTGDYLRLWSTSIDGVDNKVEMKALLNNNKHTEYCAPLTSFDWNDTDPSIVGTCSIDTTCTIWDVNKLQPKTQLIGTYMCICLYCGVVFMNIYVYIYIYIYMYIYIHVHQYIHKYEYIHININIYINIYLYVFKTQLIAHDKEVYDIAFACGKDVFGTVGADGYIYIYIYIYVYVTYIIDF